MIKSLILLIRRHIIAGLLVWIPLATTFIVLRFIINFFDDLIEFLPENWQSENLLGHDYTGFGIVFTVIIIYVTGLIVSNYLGNRLIVFWERLLDGIPFVRTIYKAIKQMTEAVVLSGNNNFSKVYLIEYPRKGLWTIAFQSGLQQGEAHRKINDAEESINLFVPTTPNPTSGYFIMTSYKNVRALDMSVDEAIKMIVSGGVYVPEDKT